MYQMILLNEGKDYDPVDSRVLMTPFEPRIGLTYRMRRGSDRTRADRFQVVNVEIDQSWDNPEKGIAWVYVRKLTPQ